MNAKKIDVLNIGLMVVSLVLAFILPFWLFLFSYAVLGPLHYLTEIGWLNKQKFFTKGRYDFIPLVIVAIIWAGIFLFLEAFKGLPTSMKEDWLGEDWRIEKWDLQKSMNDFLMAAFIGSAVMAFVKKWWLKALGLAVGFSVSYAFSVNEVNGYTFFVGALVPTLVHVYIFTGIFMLYGAIKSKSTYGYIGVGCLVLCAISCFLIPGPEVFDGGGRAYEVYTKSGFDSVNVVLLNLGTDMPWDMDPNKIFSGVGMSVQRFIAFAYTYHYLNWFSKTSIIGWHKIPKVNLISAIIIWLASLALYFYDYKIGLNVLLFLSILHVVLEFPLNIHSFVGIFTGIFGKKKAA